MQDIQLRAKPGQPIQFSGLLTNKLLTSLPGPVFAEILPHLEPVNFSPSTEVYASGQKIEDVYFPETAVFTQLSYLEDGSATEVAIIGNEGLVGLSAILECRVSPHWTHVIVGGTALKASAYIVNERFKKAASFQKLLLLYTSSYLNQVSQRAVCNSRHRLEERLCTWLLMMHDRAQGAQLPLTHELISEHLGTRRAGITNFCTLLREHGAISYHRGVVSIVNRKFLEDIACECYRAVVRFIASAH